MKKRFLSLIIAVTVLTTSVFCFSVSAVNTENNQLICDCCGKETAELVSNSIGQKFCKECDMDACGSEHLHDHVKCESCNEVIYYGTPMLDDEGYLKCPICNKILKGVKYFVTSNNRCFYCGKHIDVNDANTSIIMDENYNLICEFCVGSEETPTFDNDVIQILLNDDYLSFDQPPILINDRTMVPIRAIFEAMGYMVEWNNETQTATSIKDDDRIVVQLNNNIIKYTVNGEAGEYVCDVVPQIASGRTLVPTRAVAESAGCTVEWNGETNTVDIRTSSDAENNTPPEYDEEYLIAKAVENLCLPVRDSITHTIETEYLASICEWVARIYFYEYEELVARYTWCLESDQHYGGWSVWLFGEEKY